MSQTEIRVREAKAEDLPAVAELAAEWWPSAGPGLEREIRADYLLSPDGAAFLACAGETPAGFACCRLRRDYVEGASSSPVGYLEGIYVCPALRRRGAARALLAAAKCWAAAHGCVEFASDCEEDNQVSRQFHERMGFEEVNCIRCFLQKL